MRHPVGEAAVAAEDHIHNLVQISSSFPSRYLEQPPPSENPLVHLDETLVNKQVSTRSQMSQPDNSNSNIAKSVKNLSWSLPPYYLERRLRSYNSLYEQASRAINFQEQKHKRTLSPEQVGVESPHPSSHVTERTEV